jgi:hypothetical protein
MKREFLQNFKIGDQPLTKEVIDAIMAENGRDIEEAKKPFADYDSIKTQLQTAKDGLKAFEGVDVKDLQAQISQLQGDLTAKEQEYQGKLADMAFDNAMKEAITTAKGRNTNAILGALGAEKLAALKASKNQSADIKAALEGLKENSDYLFESDQTPPPYSPNTGTGGYRGGDASIDAIWRAAGLTPPGTEKK